MSLLNLGAFVIGKENIGRRNGLGLLALGLLVLGKLLLLDFFPEIVELIAINLEPLCHRVHKVLQIGLDRIVDCRVHCGLIDCLQRKEFNFTPWLVSLSYILPIQPPLQVSFHITVDNDAEKGLR